MGLMWIKDKTVFIWTIWTNLNMAAPQIRRVILIKIWSIDLLSNCAFKYDIEFWSTYLH